MSQESDDRTDRLLDDQGCDEGPDDDPPEDLDEDLDEEPDEDLDEDPDDEEGAEALVAQERWEDAIVAFAGDSNWDQVLRCLARLWLETEPNEKRADAIALLRMSGAWQDLGDVHREACEWNQAGQAYEAGGAYEDAASCYEASHDYLEAGRCLEVVLFDLLEDRQLPLFPDFFQQMQNDLWKRAAIDYLLARAYADARRCMERVETITTTSDPTDPWET